MRTFPQAAVETITLSTPEQDAYADLICNWGALDPRADAAAYVLNAQVRSACLPERVRTGLLRFRTDGSQQGGLLLRGFRLVKRRPHRSTPISASGCISTRRRR